ncbi:glycopeptide [Cylindrobasidium torrendii FP15055 ss-10]|uniref:Glycopeptide n=1 Tax=Cylindrobasidium torrendii FP15055 ss-10 TaxID=1314674 RepID=A0A0D7B7I7_9AGAR|nr:glycopeptide [Cylindrobasidium torrendii FP15055 ss-10]
MFSFTTLAATAAIFAASVAAESHNIQFVNNCGRGTPVLSQNFQTINNGNSYTSNGPLSATIAYLDTGCGFQGVGCAIVEMTLINGGISSTDISLIPDHAFNVPTAFHYTNGCSAGASCTNANCPVSEAFHKTDDYAAQRQCTANDNGLVITFC